MKRAELTEGTVHADKSVKAYCVAKNGMGMVTEYITLAIPQLGC